MTMNRTQASSSLEDELNSSSSSYSDQAAPSTTVTIAITPPLPPPKPPLFQRLWTDEDELLLLTGFRDYTATRGPTSSGHFHDTGPFYDHITSQLHFDFNKSQLVEKLRRLKKKYRTTLSKITSGQDFVFKSTHDHATFEISRQIWFNIKFDDDDSTPTPTPNPNPNPNPSPVSVARPVNSSYVMSEVNLNSESGGGGGGGFDMMLSGFSGNGGMGLPKLCTRKRSRVANAEKVVENVGVGAGLQELVEETVKNCLTPVLKGVIGNGASGAGVSVDERWRKQQIMELEVYSKRLELVQEQIQLSLEELRSGTGTGLVE